MQPIFRHEGGQLSRGFRSSLDYLSRTLPHIPPMQISLRASSVPPTLVWTDGAYEDAGATRDVGFIIASPRPEAEWPPPLEVDMQRWFASSYSLVHGADVIPDDLHHALVERKQQIGQVEIIGAITPYLSCPSLLAGKEVIHWIDNTSALAALMKGYSGIPDSAHLVHAFHAWNAGAGASVWFEYVPTHANPADEPSRKRSLRDSSYCPAKRARSHPTPVVFPSLARLSHPASWMTEASAAAHTH